MLFPKLGQGTLSSVGACRPINMQDHLMTSSVLLLSYLAFQTDATPLPRKIDYLRRDKGGSLLKVLRVFHVRACI